MANDKYKAVWKLIQKHRGNVKTTSFWRMAEAATNETLRNLFLSNNNNFPYLLGFDYDKIHFCYAKDIKMEWLSSQYYVKDNRHELTLHTCAYPATCILVAVNSQCIGEGFEDTTEGAYIDGFEKLLF